MTNKKILILKNDRAGDLFTSITLISTLLSKYKNITIYLSEYNIGFSFLFNKSIIKKTNFNLKLKDKINIFVDIFKNRYDEIYILSPKSFYFLLPLIFRKIKFYAIVYNSNNNLRPSYFFRKFLYDFKIVYRNKINYRSYRELQSDLIKDKSTLDINHTSINIPDIDLKLKKIIPNKFILFQFRYLFFEQLGWDIKEFNFLISQIKSKYEYILFSSDIESNYSSKRFNDYFKNNYSIIDTTNFIKKINNKNENIFYLENINSKNLFHLLNLSSINLGKHGVFSHISFFHKKKCHNLFNFILKNKDDFLHEKISYSEWYKGMDLKFSFLNKDIKKASKKILKNI